jgi:hypothetical protein
MVLLEFSSALVVSLPLNSHGELANIMRAMPEERPDP